METDLKSTKSVLEWKSNAWERICDILIYFQNLSIRTSSFSFDLEEQT